MKKQSIWVFQWRKSVHYWWSYILFSPECKELTSMLDPLLYRWGVPPVVIRCVHWTMQMWVLQTWIKALGLYIVMDYLARFWSIFVATLTLNFQGQIWNLPYLSQNWSDFHETKSKHIDWTQGLKWDHRVWPWPWPWPWIFKVKHGVGYISAKNGPIATKWKANILIELKASNVTTGFDLGHDLDFEFSRSNMEFAISRPKMVRLPRNKRKLIDWT